MAGVQVTLDGQQVYPKHGSVRVNRTAGFRSTAEMEFRALKAMPRVGQEIGVWDLGFRNFGGRVQTVELEPLVNAPAAEAAYRITAAGWEARLEEIKVPAASFQGKTDKEIIDWLFDTYVNNDVFHGVGVVETLGVDQLNPLPYQPPLVYKGVSIAAILDDLCTRSGNIWYVDPDRELYYTPRTYISASLDVTKAAANYRAPLIKQDKTDYYNKISLAIGYEAIAPTVIETPGDQSWPSFILYQPDAVEKIPLPVDAIKEITLNGATLDWKVLGSETADIYYQQGSATITWDETFIEPTADDVLRVEFWPLGANIIEAVASDSLADVQGDSGVVQAYVEDESIKDLAQAQQYCEQFLDAHCPARRGGDVGEMPSEYKWVMYSTELWDDAEQKRYVEDMQPGRLIKFAPSTPVDAERTLCITDVTMEHVEMSASPDLGGMFRYTITATPYSTATPGYLNFYQALAEVTPSSIKPDSTSTVLDTRVAVFGIPTAAAASPVAHMGWYVEVTLPDRQVFRPTAAYLTANTVSSDVAIEVEYSIGSSWASIFASSGGALTMAAGDIQMDTPLKAFASSIDGDTGAFVALDLPARTLLRCTVMSGSATNLLVHIVGEVRKEA